MRLPCAFSAFEVADIHAVYLVEEGFFEHQGVVHTFDSREDNQGGGEVVSLPGVAGLRVAGGGFEACQPDEVEFGDGDIIEDDEV